MSVETERLRSMVEAVMMFHVSDGETHQPECRGCRAECMYCEGEHSWPCETVRIVDAAGRADA